ncbi:hypothetical protein C8F01DRAFT_503880 [Mycena amicta]|nr:hypothetical protein C8F01DRAFT_503880 [Mycena amicta]
MPVSAADPETSASASASASALDTTTGLGHLGGIALYTALALAFLAIAICVEVRRRQTVASAARVRIRREQEQRVCVAREPAQYQVFWRPRPPSCHVDEWESLWGRIQPLGIQTQPLDLTTNIQTGKATTGRRNSPATKTTCSATSTPTLPDASLSSGWSLADPLETSLATQNLLHVIVLIAMPIAPPAPQSPQPRSREDEGSYRMQPELEPDVVDCEVNIGVAGVIVHGQ